MRKYLLIFIFPVILILSGCSLIPSSGTSTAGSFWKSTDGGENWEAKNKTSAEAIIPAVDILSLAVNPQNPNNILFGTAQNGIYKTTDGGENWSAVNFLSQKPRPNWNILPEQLLLPLGKSGPAKL